MCFTVVLVTVCTLLVFLKIKFIFCKWMGKNSISEYFHAVFINFLCILWLKVFDL